MKKGSNINATTNPFCNFIVAYVAPKIKEEKKMSLNLYGLIIKVATDNNINMTLDEIGRINNVINNLIGRKINPIWIEHNLETLI